MHSIEDMELLRRYVRERSEQAFSELVRRHLNLVYFAALRQTHGHVTLARDVAQSVFTDLARKASTLTSHQVISGWLYTSTKYAAANALRAEARRRLYEEEASIMHESTAPEPGSRDWERVRPVIDRVLHSLGETERQAVLLRFFEGHAFAQIGSSLRISEDAARKRVERALDKMAAGLARHGIKSTASALALALGHQAAAIAPAGLAASVAAVAFSGAVAGTGTGVAVAVYSLSAKIAAAALLCASVAGNAWLISRPHRAEKVPPAAALPVPIPVATIRLADLTGEDLGTVRDRLRVAGASDVAIRNALEGLLRSRYRDELSRRHAERYAAWWRLSEFRPGNSSRAIPGDDRVLFRTMVTEPLKSLLGVDPLEAASVDVKYGYIPAARRSAFAELEEEYSIVQWLRGQAETDGTRDELRRRREQLEAERADFAQGLTNSQREEFDLRHASFAPMVMRRMELIDGTEREYRAVFAIAQSHARAVAALAPGRAAATRHSLEQQAVQEIVATLGFDRALDYVWSGVWDYSAYARVAREADLPRGTVGRVFQLAAETADRAAAINWDQTLSFDEKRKALLKLQEEIRPAFDALFPPAVQGRLPPDLLVWVTDLGKGRYKPITTTISGNPGSIINMGAALSPTTSPTPLAGARPRQLLPRRMDGQ